MAAPDIFVQIAQLFRKEQVEGPVPIFVLHRFFASDSTYAPVAKELSRIYDDKMVTEIWKSALPKQARAPYFKYAGPKKPPASAELVKKLADIEGYNLPEAEEAVVVLERLGQHDALMTYFGIEEKKAS